MPRKRRIANFPGIKLGIDEKHLMSEVKYLNLSVQVTFCKEQKSFQFVRGKLFTRH